MRKCGDKFFIPDGRFESISSFTKLTSLKYRKNHIRKLSSNNLTYSLPDYKLNSYQQLPFIVLKMILPTSFKASHISNIQIAHIHETTQNSFPALPQTKK